MPQHSALGYLSPMTFERQWARAHGTTAPPASPPIVAWFPENASAVEPPGSTRTRGGRYLGIPLGALRDPHHQHPWYPRGCSADTRPSASSVFHYPLTAVSTKPGQVHRAQLYSWERNTNSLLES
jgi:hypothetical protein